VSNIIADAEAIATGDMFGNLDARLARYGADTLGRAIGHEIAATEPARNWLGALRYGGHGQIIAQCATGTSRVVMAHMAVRDILGS
jgi:hypothetical protein